jgi:hypothetical protein
MGRKPPFDGWLYFDWLKVSKGAHTCRALVDGVCRRCRNFEHFHSSLAHRRSVVFHQSETESVIQYDGPTA